MANKPEPINSPMMDNKIADENLNTNQFQNRPIIKVIV